MDLIFVDVNRKRHSISVQIASGLETADSTLGSEKIGWVRVGVYHYVNTTKAQTH